jgi:hypothetical protein
LAAADRVCVAVPIELAGEPVAVVYADRRASDAALPGWRATVETLVRHASRALESVAAFKAARLLTTRTTDAGSRTTPHLETVRTAQR